MLRCGIVCENILYTGQFPPQDTCREVCPPLTPPALPCPDLPCPPLPSPVLDLSTALPCPVLPCPALPLPSPPLPSPPLPTPEYQGFRVRSFRGQGLESPENVTNFRENRYMFTLPRGPYRFGRVGTYCKKYSPTGEARGK